MAEETQTPTDVETTAADTSAVATATGSEPVTEATSNEQTTPAETPTPSEDTAPETSETPSVVPESYELKPPEGQQFSDTLREAYEGIAKDSGWDNESAQKHLDSLDAALTKQQAAQVQELHESWETATKADPELGGEKLDQNLGLAKEAFAKFGNQALADLLDQSGIGNHPEVIRLGVAIARATGGDTDIATGAAAAQEQSYVQRKYPEMHRQQQAAKGR